MAINGRYFTDKECMSADLEGIRYRADEGCVRIAQNWQTFIGRSPIARLESLATFFLSAKDPNDVRVPF